MSRVLRPFPKCLNTLAFIGRLCLFGTNFFSLKPRLFEPTILILRVYLLQVTHLLTLPRNSYDIYIQMSSSTILYFSDMSRFNIKKDCMLNSNIPGCGYQ